MKSIKSDTAGPEINQNQSFGCNITEEQIKQADDTREDLKSILSSLTAYELNHMRKTVELYHTNPAAFGKLSKCLKELSAKIGSCPN